MDFGAGLLLLGVGQGLFLAVLLVIRPALRTPANGFLAALVAELALTLLDDLALQGGLFARHSNATGWLLLITPLLAPALRLHVEALTASGEWRWQRQHLRLGIVPLICLLCLGPFLASPGAMRLAIVNDSPGVGMAQLGAVYGLLGFYLLIAVQLGHALFVAWRVVRSHSANTDPATQSRLIWLRGLLIVALACWFGFLLSLLTGLFLPSLGAAMQMASSGLMVAALYALGLLGMARPDALLPPPGELLQRLFEPATRKYARSALDEADVQRIAAKLEALIIRERPYEDAALKLPRLSALIGASVNDTSQAINSAFGVNYYDYLNGHRIRAACAVMDEPSNSATILDIAFAVGFNSKSVFNAAFKRETGVTPSAWRARPNV